MSVRAHGKRARSRLAKSELWVQLAVSAQSWADSIRKAAASDGVGPNAVPPLSRWPADDPMIDLMKRYDLGPDDIARLCAQLADECETRAERSGFDQAWR